ncbi:MAG: hypothetical protein HY898_29830 [Deltaproteobacteria bacterium]|nr:hypothetical protein [Deltaproteobacteria bacterium]
MSRLSFSSFAWVAGAWILLALSGCDSAYPEVVVVNETDERIMLRELSFNGCLWTGVLAYGESTSPQRCPPGSDRVHFKKLDAAKYCQEQAEAGTIDGKGLCESGALLPGTPSDSGPTENVPRWFSYQTISEHAVSYGDFRRIEVTLTDMEQDFATPGPYGH